MFVLLHHPHSNVFVLKTAICQDTIFPCQQTLIRMADVEVLVGVADAVELGELAGAADKGLLVYILLPFGVCFLVSFAFRLPDQLDLPHFR